MVNYSIVMRSNPMAADAAKKAYASIGLLRITIL